MIFIYLLAAAFCITVQRIASEPNVNPFLIRDDCAKACLSKLHLHSGELSLLKNCNLETYAHEHGAICLLLEETEECIDKCKVDDNPFKLEMVKAHCSNATVEKFESLKKTCFSKTKGSISKTCKTKCGDYISYKRHISEVYQSMKNDPNTTEHAARLTNLACLTFKCVTRCNVEEAGKKCGKAAADTLQSLIQGILDAQHRDAEELNIIQNLLHTTPPQCNYHHHPGVMFNVTADEISMRAHPVDHSLKSSSPKDAEAQAKVRVLLEELNLIKNQQQLIIKENEKLDIELRLLREKEKLVAEEKASKEKS